MRKTATIFLSSTALMAIIMFATQSVAARGPTWFATYSEASCGLYPNGPTGQGLTIIACPIENLNGNSGWEMSVDEIISVWVNVETNFAGTLDFVVCNYSYSDAGGSCGYSNFNLALNTPTSVYPTLPSSLGGSGVWDQVIVGAYVPSGHPTYAFTLDSYGASGW
jgi:hypothetical protein